jgi:glucose/arabinose dehydrogenase
MNGRSIRASVAVALCIVTAIATAAHGQSTIFLDRIASGLSRPVFVAPAPGDDSRLFIVEQHTGQIKILNTDDNSINATPFLTIGGLSTANEQGLLGLAFHPDYANNGRFFVNVTVQIGPTTDVYPWRTEIREYRRSADPNVASASFTSVLRFDQPANNHNGGWMAFNPSLGTNGDQYLYIASGDGGDGDDVGSGHTEPDGNAQDLSSNLLGKMLRIDVNSDAFPADANRNYAIPPTNPFASTAGDDEIWAYGLRNPWRNSFDRQTGDLWIADVGQNDVEEVNFQSANSAGGVNYGWRVMEGTRCNDSNDTIPCNDPRLTGPVHEYGRGSTGGFSITGGYVYRGPVDSLDGNYFFTDYGTGNVWSFRYDGATKTDLTQWNSRMSTSAGSLANIASFGEDNAGHLYFVTLGGEIHRIRSAGTLEPIVATGAQWKYLADGSNQGTAWREAAFSDASWAAGPSELGYGDDQATVIPCGPNAACTSNNFITSYFRHTLAEFVDPSLIAELTLQVKADDGAAVYINGEEVFRSTNLAAGAGFNTPATSAISGADEALYRSVTVDPMLLLPDAVTGEVVIAAEVHQAAANSSDVSFDLRLSAIMRTPIAGDANFDGVVDRLDAAVLAENYGLVDGAMWIQGDFNADGAVSLADMAILQQNFSPIAAASGSPVPEPSAVLLVTVSFAILSCRIRTARNQ